MPVLLPVLWKRLRHELGMSGTWTTEVAFSRGLETYDLDDGDAYLILDLTPYFNSDGITSDEDRADGFFTANTYTYPEEDLPASNSIVECDGVVFRFPDKGAGRDNNISLEGQRISVPEDLYDTAHFLGASEEIGLGENIQFTFSDGGREEAFLGLSGWGRGRELEYGERVAIRCSGYHILRPVSYHRYTDKIGLDHGIWMQSVPIPSRPLVEIELPDLPPMHVFSMTLRRARMSANQEKQ